MGRGLSELQKDILIILLEYYDFIDQHGTDFGKCELRKWGMRWYPAKIWDWSDFPTGIPRAASASISRAIVRLEQRGLVLRNNGISGGTPDLQPAVDFWTREPIMASGRARKSADQTPPIRCTNLMLTDAGRELARSLTVNKSGQ